MTLTMILAAFYAITAFFSGMHALGSGRFVLAAGFGALFFCFIWMAADEADRLRETCHD